MQCHALLPIEEVALASHDHPRAVSQEYSRVAEMLQKSYGSNVRWAWTVLDLSWEDIRHLGRESGLGRELLRRLCQCGRGGGVHTNGPTRRCLR